MDDKDLDMFLSVRLAKLHEMASDCAAAIDAVATMMVGCRDCELDERVVMSGNAQAIQESLIN